jgi:hypothetical protein
MSSFDFRNGFSVFRKSKSGLPKIEMDSQALELNTSLAKNKLKG